MNREKFLELVEKQAQGNTTPHEDQLIFSFYDRLQAEGREHEIDASELKSIQNRIKANIDSRIHKKPIARQVDFRYMGRIAAAVALLISFTLLIFYTFQKPESVKLLSRTTNERQKAMVTLTDGTQVYLNSLSEIRFPEKFTAESRTVELDGEAFFEVVPDQDRPFSVISNGVITKVLGTSFNLNASSDKDVVVAVRTGKVEVSDMANLSQNVVLLPNQKATFVLDSKKLQVEEADLDYYLSWRNKTITFEMNPLDEVLDRIARVYNIEVNLNGYDGKSCLIRATYPNNNLFSILYGLQNLVDFEYQWLDKKTLEFNFKGCKN
ncbi:FecR family protein [Aquiflexum sp.]|uniref:FecR family protein n=1 Tax=Aquiflexum sp. TaxID=1872584 RepID=UPI0035941277